MTALPSTITRSLVVAGAFGGPEVLSLVEEPMRAPAAGEVLVEVSAAGINAIDWKIYGGIFGTDAAQLPMAVGLEAAGVVVATGPGAVGAAGPVAVGDEVITLGTIGAYATHVVVPAASIVPKPTSLSFEQAAGLLLVGVTAAHLLTATAVTAGDTLLVHGAAGGVGRLVTQLATRRGARVIGTAAPNSHAALRALGAEPVAYGPGLEARVRALTGGDCQAAGDCVGTDEAIDVSLALVPDRARIATIVGFARGASEGIKLLGGGPGGDIGTQVRAAARLELVELAGRGLLEVGVEAFPLAEVADVHRRAMRGETRGKLVLVP